MRFQKHVGKKLYVYNFLCKHKMNYLQGITASLGLGEVGVLYN